MMAIEDETPATTPAGVRDLRWVPLAEAVAQAGRDARQLQRWAAETKSWVRRRRRGRTVEYCPDDVLAVVGRALTEMEGALADAQVRSRTQRITVQRIKTRHKLRCTAKEAQIAALDTLITTLQDEIVRMRSGRKSWWRHIRRRW